MCVINAWSVKLTSGAVLLSDLQASLFIKIQIKYHYSGQECEADDHIASAVRKW